ncbi:MAG: hypothetical protein BWZ03_00858 [bacterium ADurb.BinA186]|nr:MAG: hypothetical protein BWZ03_00858 [bacterium ADurb.BinA186]
MGLPVKNHGSVDKLLALWLITRFLIGLVNNGAWIVCKTNTGYKKGAVAEYFHDHPPNLVQEK